MTPVVGDAVQTSSGAALVLEVRAADKGFFSSPYRVVFQASGKKQWISPIAIQGRAAAPPRLVVFLNLADRDPVGLARVTTDAMRAKGLYVIQHDVFDLLDNENAPTRDEVRADCASAHKVMLGIHGMTTDVDWGYGNRTGFGGQNVRIATNERLAQLVLHLFTAPRAWNFALIMCYGARSASYKKNHEADLGVHDVTSSFAYKLFAQICTRINVRMTARTGAVGFEQHGGHHSTVQSEEGIQAELLWTELNNAPRTAQLANFAQNGAHPPVPFYKKAPTEEQLLAEYMKLAMEDMPELAMRKSETRIKYGKFIYTYDADRQRVRVENKYAGRVLYEGALRPWSWWKTSMYAAGVVSLFVGAAYLANSASSETPPS